MLTHLYILYFLGKLFREVNLNSNDYLQELSPLIKGSFYFQESYKKTIIDDVHYINNEELKNEVWFCLKLIF